MANAIALIQKYYAEAWDEIYKVDSCSSVLEGNKGLIKTFEGTKTVKIYKPAYEGLSYYRRANNPTDGDFSGFTSGTTQGQGYGYQQADIEGEWEEFTMQIDRGAQYRIALMDDEETQGLAVGTTVKDLNKKIVIPEVDAYRFSKMVEYAGTVVNESIVTTAPSSGESLPIHALNAAFKKLFDLEVPAEDQIVFVSSDFDMALAETNELYKRLDQVEYKKDVNFTIKKYMGREIIVVPPTRFKTLISLNFKGYGWKAGSQEINFIVCRKDAVYIPIKYDKLRIFSPEVVQDYDGYKINVRIYHDLFIPTNKRFAVYASLKPTEAVNATYVTGTISNFFVDAFTEGSVRHGVIHDLAFAPGDVLPSKVKYYVMNGTAGDTAAGAGAVTLPAIGTAIGSVSNKTAVVNGDDILAKASLTASKYYNFKVFATFNDGTTEKVWAVSEKAIALQANAA